MRLYKLFDYNNDEYTSYDNNDNDDELPRYKLFDVNQVMRYFDPKYLNNSCYIGEAVITTNTYVDKVTHYETLIPFEIINIVPISNFLNENIDTIIRNKQYCTITIYNLLFVSVKLNLVNILEKVKTDVKNPLIVTNYDTYIKDIKYILNNKKDVKLRNIVVYLMSFGHIDMIKFFCDSKLIDLRSRINIKYGTISKLLLNAARIGSVEAIQYLKSKYNLTKEELIEGQVFVDSVYCGHLNVFVYLFEQCEFNTDDINNYNIVALACKKNHLDIIKYLHETVKINKSQFNKYRKYYDEELINYFDSFKKSLYERLILFFKRN